jgi:hypothetical protein
MPHSSHFLFFEASYALSMFLHAQHEKNCSKYTDKPFRTVLGPVKPACFPNDYGLWFFYQFAMKIKFNDSNFLRMT